MERVTLEFTVSLCKRCSSREPEEVQEQLVSKDILTHQTEPDTGGQTGLDVGTGAVEQKKEGTHSWAA